MSCAASVQIKRAPAFSPGALLIPYRAGVLAAPSGQRSPSRDRTPPLITNPCPTLHLFVAQRLTVTATSSDQHSGDEQLSANMGGRRGIPSTCGDTGCLSEDVVSSRSHLAQLRNRLGKVVLLRGLSYAAHRRPLISGPNRQAAEATSVRRWTPRRQNVEGIGDRVQPA